MFDKEEMFSTRGPHENIHCKNCLYNSGDPTWTRCVMFEDSKPDNVYYDGEKCFYHIEGLKENSFKKHKRVIKDK